MDSSLRDLRAQRRALDRREISVRELAEEYLGRIKTLDGELRSFITVTEEQALAGAETAQGMIGRGEAKPLTGIPMAVKDNICTEGVLTTCASKMLGGFVPPYSAAVIERLAAQGCVMLGKTNMDEFAMGSTTQTSAFGGTKNPRDRGCVPGGSSGGSAAAVAAGLCAFSLGSDTGGSIRQPAAFCGVTGMKPTYGRVSRYGLIAFASSFDQIGPIANSARDCAEVLNAICGFDRRDGTSSRERVPDFAAKIGQPVKGMKLALPEEFYGDGIDAEVRESVLAAAETYKALGAEIVECSMPSLRYAVPVYYLISSAEAASNLSRYDGIKYGHRAAAAESCDELIRRSRSEGFGDEVKRRILLGNYALSSGCYDIYYGKAMSLLGYMNEHLSDVVRRLGWQG